MLSWGHGFIESFNIQQSGILFFEKKGVNAEINGIALCAGPFFG